MSRDFSLAQVIGRAALMRGDDPAIIDGDRRLSWIEFADRIARAAGLLRAIGMAEGDRVAMLALNSHQYLEFFFAAPWGGGIFTPLNFRLAPAELGAILRNAGAEILIVDPAHAHLVAELRDLEPLREVLVIDQSYEALLATIDPIPAADRAGDDIAALFYTSGSTGVPKGVMHSHTNIVMAGFTCIPMFGLNEESVVLISGPLFHVGATGMCIPALIAGATVVLLSKFDPGQVIEAIERHRVTTMTMVPTMLRMVLDHPDARHRNLTSVRTVTFGGAPMPASLLAEALAVVGSARFIHCYGMTETTASCSSLPGHYLLPEHAGQGRAHSIGRALTGLDMMIVDAEDRPVPPGVSGEILVRGPVVMKGYWNQPEVTARTLRGGWLHTGDVGTMDERGFFFIVDRLKDMIITGGENVYSREVEEAIYSYPGVAQVAVIGIPDERWGEAVHAIVSASNGAALDPDALLAHCRGLIAGYKCPRSIDVRREPLPLNGANKINKPALRQPFWQNRDSRIV